MTDPIQPNPAGRRRKSIHSVALICGSAWAAALLATTLITAASAAGQWDFEAYYYAAKVHDDGGDPYDHRALSEAAGKSQFPFVYPHHTLAFFDLFAGGDATSAKIAYLLVKIGCLIVLVFLWSRHFVAPTARRWFLVFIIVGYNGALCIDVGCGNVSAFEQVLIWFGLFALVHNRPHVFCALIILAAQFKILPAALLALVLVTDRRDKWRNLAAGVAVCGLIMACVYLSDPQMGRSYLTSLTNTWDAGRGEVNPCAPALIADVVGELAGALPALDGISRRPISIALYGVHILVVLVLTVRATGRTRNTRIRLYLAILAYALVMPRMKDYSFVLLLVPTFELLRLQFARPGVWLKLLVLLPVAMTLPGAGVVWPYRSLLLAWVTWAISLDTGTENETMMDSELNSS